MIEDVMPLGERLNRSLTDDRYRMRLMVAFSIAAGCFALVGVYGVISRTVVRRRRELGLRVALGAPRSSIMSLVLGDAARIAVAGVAIGTIAALLASRARRANGRHEELRDTGGGRRETGSGRWETGDA